METTIRRGGRRAAPGRTDDTRARIQLAAEEILAREGVASGSMAAILRAAGQRNEAAVAYHFGSREGLVLAILDARRAPIGSMRQELLATATADGGLPTLRDSLTLLVHPEAVALRSHEGRNYLRIFADVFRRRSVAERLRPTASDARQAIRLIEARMVHLPEDLVTERVTFVISAMVEALALLACDLERQSGPFMDLDVWERDLILVMEGALNAPAVSRARPETATDIRSERQGSRVATQTVEVGPPPTPSPGGRP